MTQILENQNMEFDLNNLWVFFFTKIIQRISNFCCQHEGYSCNLHHVTIFTTLIQAVSLVAHIHRIKNYQNIMHGTYGRHSLLNSIQLKLACYDPH